jgi:RND family efflux transporter MFP subunit
MFSVFRPDFVLRPAALFCCMAWLVAGTRIAAAEATTPDVSTIANRGSLRGVLMPIASVQLSARSPGVIELFGAEEGQQVAKGDMLVQLNADVERAELARANALLEIASADWARTKRDLDRATQLNRDAIGSQKDFEDSQSVHALATGRRKQAEAEVALAEARLKDRMIPAPSAGLVFRRSRAVGEGVERLEPVIRLIDASKLELVVYGSAELLGRFKLGQPGRIMIENGPAKGTVINGSVSYVDPTMDPETSTFRVKLQVEPSDKVQPGITVSLQLPSEVN